ncbi:MAG TPA: amidohydrolase family protein [Polyangia bacterium]|jgi:predicted TIM-barrel fold metal-dependent hydrolase|nr:amidohydrolase family protein [Polyangia bacterium]
MTRTHDSSRRSPRGDGRRAPQRHLAAALLALALPLVTAGAAHGKPPAKSAPAPAPASPAHPAVDHHTHIWSLDAAALSVTPLLPPVQLPEELSRLLREKERRSKEKSLAAISGLYTPDVLVLDALAPTWLRGPDALKYLAENTVINRLVPSAYEVNGPSGYIAGTEVTDDGGVTTHVSNFLYVVKKGADGTWRISAETFTATGPPVAKARTPEELIAGLDAAGIPRAVVLSVAYWYGSAHQKPAPDEYAKVKAENDWLAAQVARHPDRLVGFFSFNPLKDYAIAEMDRCAKIPGAPFKGIKLHFGNSGVDVLNPEHIEKLRKVFRAANERRLPMVIHLWTLDKTYGREHSKAFLEKLLPAAPDVPIQIAHMAASGPGYHSDDAMEVFADAAAARDPRMGKVYFDVASMVLRDTPPKTLELVARRLRQVGMKHVLFASDWVPGSTKDTPSVAWEAFRRLPLSEDEFRTVAGNVAPYLR